MRSRLDTVFVIVFAPLVAVGLYIAYLTATYIDETVTTGSEYGFTVGSSKGQTIDAVLRQRDKHPKVAIYVSFGERAGDTFTLGPAEINLGKLSPHDYWMVLLDGPDEFSDTVGLRFSDGRLTQIHRHRQYFELP